MTYNVFSGTLNPTHFTSPVEWPSSTRDLDLDLGSGYTSYRRASAIDLYLHTKFH